MIEGDIDAVFLQAVDFAENITLDGVLMPAVIEEITPNVTTGWQRQKYEGTFARSLYIFTKKIISPPTTGRRVTLSRNNADERWTVEEVIDTNGMMRIRLKAVDS